MDFFEAQDHSRRLSRRLLFLFAAAVAAMIAVVYVAVLLTMGTLTSVAWVSGWFQPRVLGVVAAGMLLVIGSGTALRTAQLRKGGSAVAELLGGRRVAPDTADPAERRLWNVVEEMSIASGTPVPAVFVLDHEAGINAFAAGHGIHDAAVAVTRGTLESLDRDELQGVIAHEFSHILNGDMRLNLRLMGLLFGILLLAVVGRGVLRGSATTGGRRRRSGGQVAIVGVVLVILGYLGVFFGRMIQAAVSRQREFLADASAVQFTRNPDGIAGALEKIGRLDRGSRITSSHAAEAGHLFFADGMRGALSRAMATHPPLEERIRRIDPRRDPGEPVEGPHRGSPVGTASAAGFLASVGSPDPGHVAWAGALLERIPAPVRDALRRPEGSLAVVLALLLPGSETDRAAAIDSAGRFLGPDLVDAAAGLVDAVRAMGPEARLPLLDLAIPALRDLSPARAKALRRLVPVLIRADGRVRCFEYALFHILQRNLPDLHPGASRSSAGSIPLASLHAEVELVLSAVARSASGSDDEMERAFDAGTHGLGFGQWTLQPPGAVELERVDEALERLEDARPDARKALLEAAVEIVRSDRELEVEENELVRAIAEAIDTPLPPILSPDSPSP